MLRPRQVHVIAAEHEYVGDSIGVHVAQRSVLEEIPSAGRQDGVRARVRDDRGGLVRVLSVQYWASDVTRAFAVNAIPPTAS